MYTVARLLSPFCLLAWRHLWIPRVIGAVPSPEGPRAESQRQPDLGDGRYLNPILGGYYCLESPRRTVRNGYYYLTVAEGVTAGPAASSMEVSSRSKTPVGPWEHSPYNPVVHTRSKSEPWWSRGHGSLVDDREGNGWILCHGYEKG